MPRLIHIRGKRRNCHGTIAESTAGLTLLLPLMMVIIYAGFEVSYFSMLKSELSSAAHIAARGLAIEYWKDSSVATNSSLQQSLVFDNVRIHNVVNDSRQFSSVFQTSTEPHSVTVTVTYSAQYGLPRFPNPDVLNLGQISISSGAVQALD